MVKRAIYSLHTKQVANQPFVHIENMVCAVLISVPAGTLRVAQMLICPSLRKSDDDEIEEEPKFIQNPDLQSDESEDEVQIVTQRQA